MKTISNPPNWRDFIVDSPINFGEKVLDGDKLFDRLERSMYQTLEERHKALEYKMQLESLKKSFEKSVQLIEKLKGCREEIDPSLDIEQQYLIYKRKFENGNHLVKEAKRIIACADNERVLRVKIEFEAELLKKEVQMLRDTLDSRTSFLQDVNEKLMEQINDYVYELSRQREAFSEEVVEATVHGVTQAAEQRKYYEAELEETAVHVITQAAAEKQSLKDDALEASVHGMTQVASKNAELEEKCKMYEILHDQYQRVKQREMNLRKEFNELAAKCRNTELSLEFWKMEHSSELKKRNSAEKVVLFFIVRFVLFLFYCSTFMC